MSDDKRKLVALPSIPGLKLNQGRLPRTDSPSSTRTPDTTSTTPPPRRSPQATATHDEDEAAIDKDLQQKYGVYARPFIPEALRSVNRERAGRTVTTGNVNKIDYETYIASFASESFLRGRQVYSLPTIRMPVPCCHPCCHPPLSLSNYRGHFHALLETECAASQTENDNFALYRVRLKNVWIPGDQGLYSLTVPGVREDSPLIETGDTIQLRQLWLEHAGDPDLQAPHIVRGWTGVQYDATVYSVNRAAETVYLRIPKLHELSMLFNMVLPLKYRFLSKLVNALGLVVEQLQHTCSSKNGTVGTHHAWIRRMLFPEKGDGETQTRLRGVPYRRGLLNAKVNYEQLQAINSTCENDYGTLPYLISGPPGTGKTLTLVELALQLLNTTTVAHIVVCAPSDAAADTLALRLSKWLNPGQMLRLNGPQRADNEVPKQLLTYCYRERDMFYLPPFRKLMAYNVVVTSTRDIAILSEARVTNIDLHHIETSMSEAFHPEETTQPPPLHWGALLIDEAAQATELDTLPALSVVMPPATWPSTLPQPRLIMAGDENQLGPRTASRNTAFSTSLFARLFARSIYASHPMSRSNLKPSQDPPIMSSALLPTIYPPFTNLTRNYRSHPSILSVPSSLFYNDTLIPEAPAGLTSLQQSSLWLGRQWPVLFNPHHGNDELECDGGGWYNHTEAQKACDLAQRLVYEGHVKQSDIAIMSPFAAQVKRLRHMIRSNIYGNQAGLWDVNIGPVEAFQGLESRVVILCTTRTRAMFLPLDEERGLGLVGKDMKRKINVALTRAKEALIVIGNEDVLARDECWMAWMAFCWRNGLVKGEPWRDELVERFKTYKAGVLERALVVKEERRVDTGRTLGGKARMLGGSGLGDEEEMWAMGMREVLDEIAAEEADAYAEDEGCDEEAGDEDAMDGEPGDDEARDEEEQEGEGEAGDEEAGNKEEHKPKEPNGNQSRARRERIFKGIKFGQL